MLAEWGEDTAEDRDEYTAENIFRVPPEARWAHLKAQARQSTVGLTVDAAMAAIERDNPALEDVLPRDFARLSLDKQRLGQLIDLVSNIQVGDADARSRDVLGRVYEYFLSQFKVAGTTAPTNAGYVGDSGSGASGCEKSQANHGANGTVDGVRLQVDSRARELRVAGLERSDWREWSGKEQPVEPFSDDRAAFRETASGGHDEARLADCGRGDFPSYVLPEMQRWRRVSLPGR